MLRSLISIGVKFKTFFKMVWCMLMTKNAMKYSSGGGKALILGIFY